MQPNANESSAPQEVELWWGGYAARTMLPSLIVCLLLTAAMVSTAAYLSGLSSLRGHVARWVVYHLIAGLWLFQTLRWAYRVAGYEYRLTSRRLFCIWGPLVAPLPPVELGDIKTVRVEQSGLQRWLGVGQVVIDTRQDSVPLVLTGLRHPEKVAERIRQAAGQSRETSPALPVQS